MSGKKVSLLERKDLGLTCYRLKVMPENEEVNHRVIFDVKDESYIIYKVGKRPEFYGEENLRDLESRF